MFLTKNQLAALKFKSLGNDVKISDKASIYNAKNISIGNNVRIDDFCILSAGEDGIEIGNNIHIACYSCLIGKSKITLKDYCNISSKVCIYSSNDDYSGNSLTNPCIPDLYKDVKHLPVTLKEHVIVGSGCVILPGVIMNVGSAAGALSLINKSVDEFTIVSGNPAKFIKIRSRNLLQKQAEYEKYV
jgi:galactoside O-acetyltransferase